jgi:hypothetical protein
MIGKAGKKESWSLVGEGVVPVRKAPASGRGILMTITGHRLVPVTVALTCTFTDKYDASSED